MRLNTLKTVIAVLASTFHLSYTAILKEQFREWAHTNSILSKTDHFTGEINSNFRDNERTLKEKENGDDRSVAKHINEDYLSENNVKHGSKAEMDSSNKEIGEDLHVYGSEFEKGVPEKEYISHQLTIDIDIEKRFQKLVGAEDLPLPARKLSKRYKPSRYIKELFSAMLENDAHNPHVAEPSTETPIPTIRSYRGIRGKKAGHHGRSFTYDISEQSSVYSRVELVIERPREENVTYQLAVSLYTGERLDEILNSMASRHDNYLIFDITAIRKHVAESFRPVLKLTSDGEQARITKRNTPIVVVYENMATNPLLHMTSVRKRRSHKSYIIDQVPPTIGDAFDGFNCKRYDWEIDMEIFEWSWYIAPRYYNAGYCAGDCPFPLDSPVINATTYSFIKNLYNYKTAFSDEYIPRACCTPVSYYRQPILYFDRNLETVIKELPNMKVVGCGCR